MNGFNTNEPVYCPVCEPRYVNRGRDRCGVHLQVTVSNYSGCSVDIAECPECQRLFQVSYKVDAIQELKK